MKKVKYLQLLLIILPIYTYSDVTEYDCDDIAVSADGMAWDLNDQGQLITGVVVCKSEFRAKRTQYRDGVKDGKEYIIYPSIPELNYSRYTTNSYIKGVQISSCSTVERAEGKKSTECTDFSTEKTTKQEK